MTAGLLFTYIHAHTFNQSIFGFTSINKLTKHSRLHTLQLSLSLILASRYFEIKFALIIVARKTELKYTLRYLANKFAICLIKFSLLLTISWVLELFKQLRYSPLFVKNIKNFFMLSRNFIFCTTSIVTVWLIVKPFFVKNEKFSRHIVITYNEFQHTIEVENFGLSYWDHNESELLQKIVFILSNAALLSAHRAGVG